MSCCALPGGCDTPGCYLCTVMPTRFPQPKKKQTLLAGGEVVTEFAHDEDAATAEHQITNPTQDGLFDIRTGKSHNPTFTRSHRVGPHR